MDDEREKQALFADVHCRLLIQLCQTFDIPPASAWLTASKQQKHGLREATTASSQRQLPQPDHASKVRGIRGLRKPSNRERTRKRPSYYGQRKHQRKVKGGTAAVSAFFCLKTNSTNRVHYQDQYVYRPSGSKFALVGPMFLDILSSTLVPYMYMAYQQTIECCKQCNIGYEHFAVL